MSPQNRKIKITHLRTSHGIFGAESVILGLLKAMNGDDFEASVTLIGSEPDLNQDFSHEIRRLGFGVKDFLFNGRLDWTGVRRLRSYICEQNFDLIHCHDFKANFYGLVATLGTGVKRAQQKIRFSSNSISVSTNISSSVSFTKLSLFPNLSQKNYGPG